MIQSESNVWNRFIDAHPGYFDSVDYDWRVGDGMPLNKDWDESTKRMATMITQKRIDVLGWVGDQPTICEVKNRAEIGTMGQILGYYTLFIKEFIYFLEPHLLVICHMVGPDDRFVLEDHGIEIITV